MDRIPPIEPRSRFEPPLAPAQPGRVARERREQPPREEHKPPRRKPSREQRDPGDEQGDGPHIDVRA